MSEDKAIQEFVTNLNRSQFLASLPQMSLVQLALKLESQAILIGLNYSKSVEAVQDAKWHVEEIKEEFQRRQNNGQLIR